MNLTVRAFPAACRGVSRRIQTHFFLQIEDSPRLAAGIFNPFHHSSNFSRPALLAAAILAFFLLMAPCAAQDSVEKVELDYGERLFQEGHYDLCVLHFQQFLKRFETSPEAGRARFLTGESYFLMQNFDQARNAFLGLLITVPDSPFAAQAQYRIAECFEKEDRLDEAIAAFNRLVVFYPQSEWEARGLFAYARLNSGRGFPDRAVQSLRSLLVQTRDRMLIQDATLLLADVLSSQGKPDESRRLMQEYIRSHSSSGDLSPAHYRLAEAASLMGDWDEAKQAFLACAADNRMPAWQQKARFRLGRLSEHAGEQDPAIGWYRQAAQAGEDRSIRLQSLSRLAALLLSSGRTEEALEAYRKMRSDASGSMHEQALLGSGRCFEKMAVPDSAIAAYTGLFQDSVKAGPQVKKAMLHLASLLLRMGRIREGISVYGRFIRSFPHDALLPDIRLQVAKAWIRDLGYISDGLSELHRLWSDHPDAGCIPEARYLYGEALEKAQRIMEAVQVWEDLNTQFPGTRWASLAAGRLQSVKQDPLVHSSRVLARLAPWLSGSAGSRDLEQDYNWAVVMMDDLHSPASALPFLRRSLETPLPDTLRGDVYLRMAVCFIDSSQSSDVNAPADSARKYFHLAESILPGSSQATAAALAHAQFESGVDVRGGYWMFQRLLAGNPGSPLRGGILYGAAKAALAMDSLQPAMPLLRELAARPGMNARQEEALYLLASGLRRLGRYEESDSLFQSLLQQNPRSPYASEALFQSGRMAAKQGDTRSAMAFFREVRSRFPLSPFSDSCLIDMGYLSLDSGNATEAVTLFSLALAQDSLQALKADAGLSDSAPSRSKAILRGLGKACLQSGRYREAERILLDYSLRHSSREDRIAAYADLSAVAEQEGKPDKALSYLQQVADDIGSAAAFEKLGDLRFRLEQYNEARAAYEKALLRSGGSDVEGLNAKIMLCFLSMNNVAAAESRLAGLPKALRKTIEGSDWMPRLEFEKGNAFFRNKDFDQALKSYETVIKKYRDSRYVPLAKLETGRTYLVLNKVEEALGLLTAMTSEYAGSPVLGRVYLNLGDHYFRSQQYDNALRALRMALSDGMDPESVPLAMRYLIRVYDSLGMWDAALALARQYIEKYPGEEDVQEKKVQIGLFYFNLKDYRRAIEYLRPLKNEVDEQTEPEIQYWIAKSYVSMGMMEQGIYEFLRVKYLSRPTRLPWASTALFEAARAYLSIGNTEGAKDLFSRVVQAEGSTSDLGRIARQNIEEIENAVAPKGTTP
ncbi:tetratricopeptide repeat protein [bacterium]|nr:tetratricopeptide repeat protein [bacterium]